MTLTFSLTFYLTDFLAAAVPMLQLLTLVANLKVYINLLIELKRTKEIFVRMLDFTVFKEII